MESASHYCDNFEIQHSVVYYFLEENGMSFLLQQTKLAISIWSLVAQPLFDITIGEAVQPPKDLLSGRLSLLMYWLFEVVDFIT